MRTPVFVVLMLLAVALAGCTGDRDGGGDGSSIDPDAYNGPKAEIWHTDVTPGDVEGGADDFVDCGTATHLYVEYIKSPLPPKENHSSDFTVKVFSESSRQTPVENSSEGGDAYQGIVVWPFDEEEGQFSGHESGTFETDITWGSAGKWRLNVQRSVDHAGEFIVRLTCL